MSDLLHIVKGLSAQPKCVLVLGARTEATLNWLFSLTASRVLLVEPEPTMFEKAKAMHNAKGKPENVTILHGVPAFELEQKTVSYFASNVPGFSSVLPPNVIKSIRPALEFTEQEAPVIDLKPLLQQFDVSEGRPCLLVSQLNGAEQQCLNNQIVNAFTHVVIQSSQKPIFGESKPVENLKKRLVECGRDYLELTEPMPPYSNFVAAKKVNAEQALNYFSQRQQHREIRAELESQLGASQTDAKKVNEDLQQTKQQLRAAKQQSEEKQKQLGDELRQAKEQLQTARQEAEGKQKQLGEDLQQAKQQLQAAKQEAEGKQKHFDDELQQAKEQLQAAKQQSEEKQKQLGEELQQAKQQLQTAKQEAEGKQKQLGDELQQVEQKMQTERQRFEEAKASLNNELELQRQALETVCSERDKQRKELLEKIEHVQNSEKKQVAALELTSKLNLKLQADLDALRDSYAKKAKDETELTELVNELYAKLQHASQFYYELEKKYPELIEEQRG